AVRSTLDRIIAENIVGVRPGDPAKAEGEIATALGLEGICGQRSDTQSPQDGIVRPEPDLAVGQPDRAGSRKPHRIGERRARSRVSRRDTTVAAPVPVRIGEAGIARDLANLALGDRDVGTMPSEKPPAK